MRVRNAADGAIFHIQDLLLNSLVLNNLHKAHEHVVHLVLAIPDHDLLGWQLHADLPAEQLAPPALPHGP